MKEDDMSQPIVQKRSKFSIITFTLLLTSHLARATLHTHNKIYEQFKAHSNTFNPIITDLIK